MKIEEIPLSQITLPPELDRDSIDPEALRELAASIESVGLLNPITVEVVGDHYMLRAGRRRMEAHRLLHRTYITANIREPSEMGQGDVITWAENLDRADLSKLEEARSVKRFQIHTGFSPAQLGKKLHRSPDWIRARLDLLDAPEALQQHVHKRELAIATALELARVTNDDDRDRLTHYALMSGASLTVIKDWVAQWRLHQETHASGSAPMPPILLEQGRITVLVPCLTCATPFPAETLRIVRICNDCLAVVTGATNEWRQKNEEVPAEKNAPGSPPRDSTDSSDTQVSPETMTAAYDGAPPSHQHDSE